MEHGIDGGVRRNLEWRSRKGIVFAHVRRL
jgi:hypothetical protein